MTKWDYDSIKIVISYAAFMQYAAQEDLRV